MAHIIADRVYDTSTTTGTGALTLSGSAPTGYRTFSAVMTTNDTCYYSIVLQAGSEWETGLGTYSAANTLTRTTVYASSNSNNAVSFSAGTKDVFLTFVASRSLQLDDVDAVNIKSNTGTLKLGASTDLILGRNAAANLRLGAADVAAPVAQTLSVQSVVTGTSNTAGTDFTIAGSKGTGTGAGGSILFQTAAAGSTGTSQNALATAMTITSAGRVGIGKTPVFLFDVYSNSVQGRINIESGSSALYGPGISIVDNRSGSTASSYTVAVGGYDAAFYINDNTNNAVRFFIENTGKVGIGTTSPSQLLDIYSATSSGLSLTGDSTVNLIIGRYSTDTSGPLIVLRKFRGTKASPTAVASGDSLGGIYLQGYGGTNNRNLSVILGYVDTYTSDTNISSGLRFLTSPSGSADGTEKMRITAAGDVGIGTITPLQTTANRTVLTINGTSSVFANLAVGGVLKSYWGHDGTNSSLNTAAGNLILQNDTANPIIFYTNGANERMRIDSSGLVGIGTASPSVALDVRNGTNPTILAKTTGSGYAALHIDSSTTATQGYIFFSVNGTEVARLTGNSSNYLAFATGSSATERMRIDGSGNALVTNVAGLGYGTGSGGTVTQGSGSGKATGVTLSKPTGQITMNNATLNAAAEVSFTVTNTLVAATDTVIVNHSSAGTAGSYGVFANNITAGTFDITVTNLSGSNRGEAIVVSFSIIKGASA